MGGCGTTCVYRLADISKKKFDEYIAVDHSQFPRPVQFSPGLPSGPFFFFCSAENCTGLRSPCPPHHMGRENCTVFPRPGEMRMVHGMYFPVQLADELLRQFSDAPLALPRPAPDQDPLELGGEVSGHPNQFLESYAAIPGDDGISLDSTWNVFSDIENRILIDL